MASVPRTIAMVAPAAASTDAEHLLEMGYDAFAPSRHGEHYLTYYGIDGATKAIQVRRFTRGEFWALGCRAAALLQEAGLTRGDAATHYFTDNRLEDLAFRLGAVLLGTVPVTINWQADTPERVVHKVRATKSKAMVVDPDVPAEQIEACREAMGGALAIVVAADRLAASSPLPAAGFASGLRKADPRIVIFTSGTTGQPKGVSLSYGAYDTNRATFEDFLQVPAEGAPGTFELVVTNPMHHTNSTAVTDWTLRRPGASLHLLQRYTTQYWLIVACVAAGVAYPPSAADAARLAEAAAARAAAGCRVVAPLVSRHVDFLAELHTSGKLPLDAAAFRAALSAAAPSGAPLVTLLLGSAPVGPTTVERLTKCCGLLPTVRFGSTETCLQVLGTPLPGGVGGAALAPFERGWAHAFKGHPSRGYYIGRPHPPHTEARVVRGVTPGAPGYLESCEEGEPGQLICRGGFLMSGYVGDEAATARAIHADAGGWYVNLGDVCFTLRAADGEAATLCARGCNPTCERLQPHVLLCDPVRPHAILCKPVQSDADGTNYFSGGDDFYWLSRDSALLIRGGANYSHEQINSELTLWAQAS